MPALTDGDLVLFESGAMVQYVLQVYGEGRLQPPTGSEAWARHFAWMWFGEATLSRPMGANRILRGGDLAGAVVEKVADALDGVELAFSGRDAGAVTSNVTDKQDTWLLGDRFDAADIMVSYTLVTVEKRGLLQGRPVLRDYVDRLKLREACQVAFNA